MRRPDRVLLNRLLLVALVCNLLLLSWYLAVDYRAYLHSDSAVKNILAQEMLDTGSYFPAQWNYVNGDLWVFFTQTLVLPFLLVLPNGFGAHAGADLVAAAMVLHATWLLARITGQSQTARLASVLVVSAGLSLNLAENLFGQAAYGLLFAMAVWLVVCSLRAVGTTGRRRLAWTAGAAVILMFVCWANPQRAAAYYVAPLMAGAAVALIRRRIIPRLRDAVLPAALLAGAVVGTLLYVHTRGQVASTGAVATVFYVGAEGARANAARLLEGLFLLFAEPPLPGSRVLTGRGVVAALYLVVTATFLFALLPWSIRRAWRQGAARVDAVLAFALSGLAVALFFALATTLTSYSSSDGAIRYLVPHLMVLLVIFVGAAVDMRGPVTPLAVVAVAIVALFGVRSLATYGPVTGADFTRVHTQQADRMIAFMLANGLEYGYAPFWDAGRMTVLASHRIRFRQITIQSGLPLPMRHLGSDRWYMPETWHGKTFLLLNTEEQKTFRPDLMASRAGAPAATLDFEGWKIVVYDHNIAADLPAWDTAYHTVRHFAADAGTPHLVGKVEQQPAAIVAAPGEAGPLAFGQNLALQPGKYTAIFDIEAEGTGAAFGSVDAASAAGDVVHGKLPITAAGRQQLRVPLNVERTSRDLELRVFSSGSGRLALYGVTLQRNPESN